MLLLFFVSTVGLEVPPGWATEGLQRSLAPSHADSEVAATIHIKHRKFQPETVTLSLHQKVRLTIKNHDTELHAFVPVGLLSRIHMNVSGNGAPQFGKEGLLRVLLPSQGQTDIVFIPSRLGTYPFFCDLPGHVMRGNIVVQENGAVVQ